MLDGFKAKRWKRLDDERGPRLLVSDDDRTVVVAAFDQAAAIDAEAEKLASAVLRSILPTERSFAVPRVIESRTFRPGQFSDDECCIAISQPLEGAPMSTEDFRTAPSHVDSLAECLAVLHSAETGPIADAGLVVHESQEVRGLLWDLLDRGAATGQVPPELLERWETVLETPAVWHFLPVPLHGDLTIDALRTNGKSIVTVADFSSLRVGDPAVDLESVSHLLDPEEFDRFLRVYTERVRHDDAGLRSRIDLRSEMAVLELLLTAVDSGDKAQIKEVEVMLADLAALTAPQGGNDAAADSGAVPQPDASQEETSQAVDKDSDAEAEEAASDNTAAVDEPQSAGEPDRLRPLSFDASDDDGDATDVIDR